MGYYLAGSTLQIYTPAPPAPGQNLQIPVPNGHVYVIRMLAVQFVASATAGSRTPSMNILDINGNMLFAASVAGAPIVTAGQTVSITCYVGPTNMILNVALVIPYPPGLMLPPGATINITFANIASGDQFQNIMLEVDDYAATQL